MHWWQFKGWDGHQFFSKKKKTSSFTKLHINVKHHETKCKAQEPQLWIAYFWSYCPLKIENCLHENTDFHLVICVKNNESSAETTQMYIYT